VLALIRHNNLSDQIVMGDLGRINCDNVPVENQRGVDFADIVKQFQETAAKIPELEGSKRLREMTQRRVNTVTPAVQLTPEEIKARREKELAEIRLAEEA
jgi:hypothetical protein